MNIELDPGFRVQASAPTKTLHDDGQPELDKTQFERPQPIEQPLPDMGEAVTRLEDHVQTLRRELHFRVDETTGVTVVRVVDAETGILVRQIPSQDVLDLVEHLDQNTGALLRTQV